MAEARELTPEQWTLLEWLSREESSQLGECSSASLAVLIELGLAELKPDAFGRKDPLYQRVVVTDPGRAVLAIFRAGGSMMEGDAGHILLTIETEEDTEQRPGSFEIGIVDDQVALRFHEELAGIGMTPDQAVEMALGLIDTAQQLAREQHHKIMAFGRPFRPGPEGE